MLLNFWRNDLNSQNLKNNFKFGQMNGKVKYLLTITLILTELYLKSQDIVMDIDSNTYKLVKIASQVWMAENLKCTHYSNGDPVTRVNTEIQWNSLSIGAYCIYYNEEYNKNIYGMLYNWMAAADSRNICPEGFHVPDMMEWQILINNLGGEKSAGGKMKETGSTHWKSPNVDASNESGFTALPGGLRNAYGNYNLINDFSLFWTSSEHNKHMAIEYYLHYKLANIIKEKGSKLQGNSVRCIKD
jgi:uncharacterized protein (TIGR02145 family)